MSVYLVPQSLADEALADGSRAGRKVGWRSIPGQAVVLLEIHWSESHWREREKFEGNPAVLALGDPWSPVPAAAVEPLEALRGTLETARSKDGLATDSVTALDTVSGALRKAAPHLA